MAKWKNALLISTIVAPIAFGASPLGDVLAAPKADRPSKTSVVLHKQLTSDNGNSEVSYWGNGKDSATAAPNNPFTGDDTWKPAGPNFEFTAFQIPTKVQTAAEVVDPDTGAVTPAKYEKVISFDKDDATEEPKISDEAIAPGKLQLNGQDMKWSDLIKATEQPMEGDDDAHEASNTNKDYVIQWSLGVASEAAQDAFTKWVTNATPADKQGIILDDIVDETDASGKAVFNGSGDTGTQDALSNGNWIILETDKPKTAGVTTIQQGMVLSLPMMDAYSIKSEGVDSDNYWFGQPKAGATYTDNVLNLYPKDFSETATMTVKKVDSTSGAELAGFNYTVFVASKANQEAIQTALTTAVKGGATVAATLADMLANKKIVSIESTKSTGSNGQTPDFDLDPTNDLDSNTDQTYFIVESGVPAVTDPENTHYLLDATIQPMVFTEGGADTLTVANPNIKFNGAVWDVNNFKPDIDKSITIGDATEAGSSATFGQKEGDSDGKDGGDSTYGVDRGQEFLWNIQTDLSTDASDYDRGYEIVDTLPYQTNWMSASVDVAGIAGLFALTHNVPGDVTGGLTGHGITYGNGTETVDVLNPGTGADQYVLPSGWTYNAGLTLTADYDALASDANVKAAVDAILPAASQSDNGLRDWLNEHIAISGVSSTYSFDSQKRVATPVQNDVTGATNKGAGQLKISLDDKARELFSAMAAAQTTASKRTIDLELTAKANSAAQATDTIKNKSDFNVENQFDSTTDKDTVNTFDAGWEIVKTDADDEPLAGAGFDLAVEIPSDPVKRAALLNNFYTGKGSTDFIYNAPDTEAGQEARTKWENMFLAAAKSKQFSADEEANQNLNIFEEDGDGNFKLKDDTELRTLAWEGTYEAGKPAESSASQYLRVRLISMMTSADYQPTGQGVLYFMHKDAETGASMPSMDMSSADPEVMGDVIWTPVAAWATNHLTDDAGYLQYCGLAAGNYALIETKAPTGYALMDTEPFTLGGTDFEHAEKFTLGKPGTTLTSGSAKPDQNGEGPASGTIDGKADIDDDVQIIDQQKSIFPLVGGLGTLFAVIAGLLAMGLALLKRKEDMKNEA